MKLFILAGLLLINPPQTLWHASTDTIEQTGKVIKVVDGDTFDILTDEKSTLRIRMNGIDCPERKQDFYQSAKKALADYIFSKEVRLVITGHDRNKRAIAMVYSGEENINLAMIRNGHAWHYKKYSADAAFAKAEVLARKERKGLWNMNNPIPPWVFRKK